MFFNLNRIIKKTETPKPVIKYINDNVITFCTCWYVVKSKFGINKYLKWIKNILSIVNNFNLVIYTDQFSLKTINHLIDYGNKRIKIIIKPIENFYTYKYSSNWVINNSISKLPLHEHTSWKLNMLWNEKVFFVQDAIKNKYFDSMYYGWCDIGYFRNGIDDMKTNLLNSWPNHNVMLNNVFKNSYIHYGCVQNNAITYGTLSNEIKDHYKKNLKSPPTKKYEELVFAGGFFILNPSIIDHYASIYDSKLKYYFDNNYIIKDDQTIIADIIFTNENLFYIHTENHPYFNNWFMFQRILF